MKEINTAQAGFTYDTKEYVIYVCVYADGQATIQASIVAGEEHEIVNPPVTSYSASFENKYDASNASLFLKATLPLF